MFTTILACSLFDLGVVEFTDKSLSHLVASFERGTDKLDVSEISTLGNKFVDELDEVDVRVALDESILGGFLEASVAELGCLEVSVLAGALAELEETAALDESIKSVFLLD